MASSLYRSTLPMSLGQKRAAAKQGKAEGPGRPRKLITAKLQAQLTARPNEWKRVARSIPSSEGTRYKKQAAELGLVAQFVSTASEKRVSASGKSYVRQTGDLYVSFQKPAKRSAR